MIRFTRPLLAGPLVAGLLMAGHLPAAMAGLPGAADGLTAADPAAQASPPAWPLLPAEPSSDPPALPEGLPAARAQWQRVNDQVAAFARGHIDLLRWEQARAEPAAAQGSTPSVPPAPPASDEMMRTGTLTCPVSEPGALLRASE